MFRDWQVILSFSRKFQVNTNDQHHKFHCDHPLDIVSSIIMICTSNYWLRHALNAATTIRHARDLNRNASELLVQPH